jgi:hypothetical protein
MSWIADFALYHMLVTLMAGFDDSAFAYKILEWTDLMALTIVINANFLILGSNLRLNCLIDLLRRRGCLHDWGKLRIEYMDSCGVVDYFGTLKHESVDYPPLCHMHHSLGNHRIFVLQGGKNGVRARKCI